MLICWPFVICVVTFVQTTQNERRYNEIHLLHLPPVWACEEQLNVCERAIATTQWYDCLSITSSRRVTVEISGIECDAMDSESIFILRNIFSASRISESSVHIPNVCAFYSLLGWFCDSWWVARVTRHEKWTTIFMNIAQPWHRGPGICPEGWRNWVKNNAL